MTMLISGLLLWSMAHLFKRLLPRQREALGKAGRGLVALAILGSLVLMVFGYRAAETEYLYALPGWAWHANNTLMLIALFLMDIGRVRGVVRTKIRHPMLTSVLLWTIAHLLVNGDTAAVVLGSLADQPSITGANCLGFTMGLLEDLDDGGILYTHTQPLILFPDGDPVGTSSERIS